jgi:hypothetical protein
MLYALGSRFSTLDFLYLYPSTLMIMKNKNKEIKLGHKVEFRLAMVIKQPQLPPPEIVKDRSLPSVVPALLVAFNRKI